MIDDTNVTIAIAVVPAGAAPPAAGGRAMQRLTLSFSPVARAGCGLGDTFDISDWPAAVERMLTTPEGAVSHGVDWPSLPATAGGNLVLEASAIAAGSALPLAPVAAASAPCARAMFHESPAARQGGQGFEAWREARKKDIECINRLWRLLMAPEDVDWRALKEVLQEQTFKAQLAHLQKDEDGKELAAPDIVSARRGRAATLLVQERALSLKARIDKPSDGPHAEQNRVFNPHVAGAGATDGVGLVHQQERDRAAKLRTLLQKLATADAGSICSVYEQIVALISSLDDAGGSQSVIDVLAYHEAATAVPRVVGGRTRAQAEGDSEKDAPPTPDEAAWNLRRGAARARLMAITANPLLARLFNFTVDVLAPTDLLAPGSQFALLNASLLCRKPELRAWTIAKRSSGAFWPCERAEAEIYAAACKIKDIEQSGILSLHDGFAAMGASCKSNDGKTRRFELATLDIHEALSARETTVKGDQNRADLLTLRSGGIAIVDHWRQWGALSDVLATLHKTDAKQSGPMLLDARNLQVGAQIDVGFRGVGHEDQQWRPLMARTMRFDPENRLGPRIGNVRVQALIERAVPDAGLRDRYSAAVMAPIAKLGERYKPGAGDNDKATFLGETAYLEDVLAQWTGTPMGIDASRDDGKVVPISVNASEGLALSIEYGLPHRGSSGEASASVEDLLPPRQIIGLPYWFRMRAQFLGGVALPPNRPYATAPQIPASGEQRRYLRHERIEAPVLTLPDAILKREFDGTPDGLRESAALAVVRSDWSQKNRSSLRFIVPPSVSAQFADAHGLFPEAGLDVSVYGGSGLPKWNGPADGLRDVAYDDPKGGFAKVRLPSGGKYSAVFKPREGNAPRPLPYYPDPAADYIVIALNDAEGRRLAGEPLVVPVRPRDERGISPSWPAVRPIALEVVASEASPWTFLNATTAELRQTPMIGLVAPRQGGGQKLLSGAQAMAADTRVTTRYFAKGDALTERPDGGAVAVSHVRLSLPAGLTVQIQVWCLPAAQTLLQWFDVVESLTALDVKDAPAQGGFCAVGMKPVSAEALRAKARLIEAFATTRPAPEIAASVGLLATHGVPQPRGAVRIAQRTAGLRAEGRILLPLAINGPEPKSTFAGEGVVGGEVEVDRLTTASIDVCVRGAGAVSGLFDDPSRARSADEATRGLWPTSLLDDEPRTPRDIFGFDVDPATGKVRWPEERAILLTVHDPLPPPASGSFGARALGVIDIAAALSEAKALDDELTRVAALNELAAAMIEDDDARADLKAAEKASPINQARVDDESARVRAAGAHLPAAQAAADRLTSGAPRAFAKSLEELRALPIEVLKLRRALQPKEGRRTRVETPARILDPRARVLTAHIEARSRTADLFRAPPTPASASDEALHRGDQLPGRLDGTLSNEEVVIVRARVQPGRVSPLTIRPAFRFIDCPAVGGAIAKRRVATLRVRMRRPWFSSGAGERLGIVLWPPAILGRIGASANTVTRDGDVKWPFESADMDFMGWSDEDLGPGGGFVTRWGADPIRAGRRPEGWLVRPSQFLDMPEAGAVENADWFGRPEPWDDAPRYVPNVAMPLPADSERRAREPTLNVGLLTYEPRFDLDSETWFVDVPFDPLDAAYPFVRLGLVRFQPYAAARELCVSEPVVEWAQVPPSRTITVARQRNDPQTVTITVEGPSQTHAKAELGGVGPEQLAHWLQRPAMRMRLVTRGPSGHESPCRLAPTPAGQDFAVNEEVPETQGELDLAWGKLDGSGRPRGLAVLPDPHRTAMRWTRTYKLRDDPAPRSDGTRVIAIVEEVEAMRPASYAHEPRRWAADQGGEADHLEDIITVSGPRFAARVEVH